MDRSIMGPIGNWGKARAYLSRSVANSFSSVVNDSIADIFFDAARKC